MNAASIRASDAEREAVTRLLQQAVADGRLTPEEAGERLASTSAARFRDELEMLVRDLPAIAETARPAVRRLAWLGFATQLVRGIVFATLFVGLALWGIGLLLPFWIFGLVALAVVMRGRTRRYRVLRWRGWHGTPGRFRPSSLPW